MDKQIKGINDDERSYKSISAELSNGHNNNYKRYQIVNGTVLSLKLVLQQIVLM